MRARRSPESLCIAKTVSEIDDSECAGLCRLCNQTVICPRSLKKMAFYENDRSGAEKTSENSFELSDETRGRRLGTIRTDDEDHRTSNWRSRLQPAKACVPLGIHDMSIS